MESWENLDVQVQGPDVKFDCVSVLEYCGGHIVFCSAAQT